MIKAKGIDGEGFDGGGGRRPANFLLDDGQNLLSIGNGVESEVAYHGRICRLRDSGGIQNHKVIDFPSGGRRAIGGEEDQNFRSDRRPRGGCEHAAWMVNGLEVRAEWFGRNEAHWRFQDIDGLNVDLIVPKNHVFLIDSGGEDQRGDGGEGFDGVIVERGFGRGENEGLSSGSAEKEEEQKDEERAAHGCII